MAADDLAAKMIELAADQSEQATTAAIKSDDLATMGIVQAINGNTSAILALIAKVEDLLIDNQARLSGRLGPG